ncbi:MAG: hypothetical protein Q4C06_02995 [Bacillota bacterium]|nr:hypothetical protein [Bacillota bacterium]
MWYALTENSIEYYKEQRLLFGESIEEVAEKLMQLCDAAMSFDLEEMTMDDINGYYTEGYEEYEALEEAPAAEKIEGFRFQCNDTEIRVLSLTDSMAEFREAYARHVKGSLRGWQLREDLAETREQLALLDRELKAISDGAAPEDVKCFTAR